VNYLVASNNEANQARATEYQESHELSDLLATVRLMPEGDFIEKRNKAMLSLCILTSPRISSLQTTRVSSVRYMKEFDAWALLQNPKTQSTKKAGKITSFFVGNSHDIINNVASWREYLISQGFKKDDYLFPKLDSEMYPIEDDQQFIADLLREEKVLMVQGSGFNWVKRIDSCGNKLPQTMARTRF
jgi:hypothetical protein